MKSETKLGTFEEVLKGATPTVQAIAHRLRAVIAALHHECSEVPRPGEPSIAYGVGPKKMSEAYAYLMPQKSYVNLGFYHGVALSDPSGLLEGSGKALRHVKIHTLDAANLPEVKNLILESIRERKAALGLH
jgi:hypothetical protein